MAQAAERAHLRLRAAILKGEYRSGERLGEVELAESLHVSRTPVREALHRLAAEGLVEIEPNRGARVAHWRREDLEEIYELRALLEGSAARRAAERADAEVLAALGGLCDAMDMAARPGRHRDLDRVAALNAEFHGLVMATSGSPRLAAMLGQVVHVPLVARTYHRYDEAALARSMGHHRELAAAMRSHDGPWAESVMRSHVHAARCVLSAALEDGAPPDEQEVGS